MVQEYASRIHAKIQTKLHLERFYWKFIAISHAISQCRTMHAFMNRTQQNNQTI